MNEALIHEKLDALTLEVQALKASVTEQQPAPAAETPVAATASVLQEASKDFPHDQLVHHTRTLLASLEELSEVATAIKAGVELKNDLGPVVQQAYPKSMEFFAELEGDFHLDEIIILLRKALTNLDTVGEGLDMLKAGVELRDDLVPVLQILYPRVLKFLNALHEGEFQTEKLGDLLYTLMLNVHTLSDLLNMIAPMTEFVKEVQVLLQETDVIQGMNLWLEGLQQSSGLFKLAGTMFTFMKRLDYNDKQIEEICNVIENLDFNQAKPVGPIGMVKMVSDPKVQQAMGFMFMMLQAMGSCLQAYQTDKQDRAQMAQVEK
jgi:uncharacterized protein YjgD (DUF1641 family)